MDQLTGDPKGLAYQDVEFGVLERVASQPAESVSGPIVELKADGLVLAFRAHGIRLANDQAGQGFKRCSRHGVD